MADIDVAKATADFNAFKQQCKTLQLATVNEEGQAQASYAPFVWYDSALHIFVSELAAHTRDMLAQKKVGVLLIADESVSENLFARERISYQCHVNEIARDDAQAEMILDALQERQGKLVSLLRGLSDFHLLKLTPFSGSYVQGFGKAFELTGEDLAELRHVSRL